MTTATATKTRPRARIRATPADLEAMPDGEARYELVDGEIRERSMSAESNYVGGNIFGHLWTFVRAHNLGHVFADGCGIAVFPEPNPLRVSDGAFVAAGRLPGDRPPSHGYLKLAPDLVVEVVSPNDNANDIQQKVEDYLKAGVRLAWVAYPDTRFVHAFAADGTVRKFGPEADLDGGDVLNGFSVAVAQLFPQPA